MKRSRYVALVLVMVIPACFLEIVEPTDDLGEETAESGSSDDESDPETTCGNGVREVAEQCEGQDLNGQTCAELGYLDGTLACSDACTFDFSGCTQPVCGDGVADNGEECDSQDFAGRNCETFGLVGGDLLACTQECVVDTSGCAEA